MTDHDHHAVATSHGGAHSHHGDPGDRLADPPACRGTHPAAHVAKETPSMADVATRSAAVEAMLPDWELAAALLGGTRAMRAAGIEPDGGPIRLLTMPRLLGWAFNPLSTYFCQRRDGTLAAILWEVDNTFHQRHAYMIPVDRIGPDAERCLKVIR